MHQIEVGTAAPAARECQDALVQRVWGCPQSRLVLRRTYLSQGAGFVSRLVPITREGAITEEGIHKANASQAAPGRAFGLEAKSYECAKSMRHSCVSMCVVARVCACVVSSYDSDGRRVKPLKPV